MRILNRYKNTADEWRTSAFILAKGEMGVALDTGESRYGNGVDVWGSLPSSNGGVQSVAGRTGVVSLTAQDVGLGNVDNTSDNAKPISAAQAAVNAQLQDQIASVSFTGGVTKETIGLGNVDNTSDVNKPISTATQIQLNTKAPINNPIFTGNVQGVTKSMVGLAQVDNTADKDKPVSTAVQTQLDTKASATDLRLAALTVANGVINFATDTQTVNIHGVAINIGTTNTAGTITLTAQTIVIDDAGTTSDARDKADIRDTRLGLEFIKSLRPVEYRWAKRDERVQGKRYHQGFIAQDVKKTADDLGIDFGGYYDQRVNGGPDKLGLRTQEFHAPMVKAIQELAARVEYLEARQCNHDDWT